MKHPMGTNRGYGALHRTSILEVHGVRRGRFRKSLQTPVAMCRAQQQVHLVAVAYRPSREIGTDEPARSGDQDPFGHALVVCASQITAGRAVVAAGKPGSKACCGLYPSS